VNIMNNKNEGKKDQIKKPLSREDLILMEREIINELQKMLKDPDLTLTERLRTANVLAYHVNTLNKMVTQNGEKEPFEEKNLGDYVRGVYPRIATRFRRDFRVWKRTLSYRKS
jgi:hypothetical protein